MTYDPTTEGNGYGAEVDFGAMLAVQLGRLTDHLEREAAIRARRLERAKQLVPMHYDALGSAVATAAGLAVIDLSSGGLPSAGRIWEVRRWIVGSNGVSPATGQAWLCATGMQAGIVSAATVPLGDVVDASGSGAGLPYGNTFGAREVIVNEQERLVAVVIGGSAGATYLAAASVDDIDTRAEITAATTGI